MGTVLRYAAKNFHLLLSVLPLVAQSPKDALILLLHRAYEAIMVIEDTLGIIVSPSDLRPRIEGLHDAVRAYASSIGTSGPRHPRLSVEQIARDAALLKQLTEQPLHPNLSPRRQSPSQAVMVMGAQPTAPHTSEARSQLKQSYTTYGVLFVALLAEAADKDFRTRQDTGNAQVEELDMLEAMVREAANKGMSLTELANHVFDPALKAHLQKRATQAPKKMNGSEMIALLQATSKAVDANIAKADKAHFAFAAAQLGFYEQSRDVVKQLAVQGMNLAGKFVQQSLQTAAGKSRGM
jgi:hypothetical protein